MLVHKRDALSAVDPNLPQSPLLVLVDPVSDASDIARLGE
jgi:hypothetical protein